MIVEHAKENHFPLTDPFNYGNKSRSGRPAVLRVSKVCSYGVFTRENRDKSVEQHIQELDLVLTFTLNYIQSRLCTQVTWLEN